MKERIDKILTEYNICTRSEAKKLIKAGCVIVNDITVKDSKEKFDTEIDIITVNGKRLSGERNVYIMMNKPQGVVSATQDNLCKTVIDILPDELKRKGLFPAGRLDKDTEGLMLITNDGELAHNILSPNKHVDKKYFAKTDVAITQDMINLFKDGIVFSDGTRCKPALLEVCDNGCYVTICEGKFHQVKKMLACVGAKVLYLKRLQIGGLILDDKLMPGECRLISQDEIKLLFLNKNKTIC